MSFVTQIVLLVISTCICIFIFLTRFLIKEKIEFHSDLKVFILEDLFYIGNLVNSRIKIPALYQSKRYKNLCIIFDDEHAKKLQEEANAAVTTYAIVFMPIFLTIFAASKNVILFLLEIFLLAFLCMYFDFWLKEKLAFRQSNILSEYPIMVSKLVLMIKVGITASDAFEKVAGTSQKELYIEMQKVVSDVFNGKPYSDALDAFATRCPYKEIRKFVSLYKQNLIRGGPEFPFMLGEMSRVAWQDRKNSIKIKAEFASQKLLVPIMLMFIGILIMVIVPAFENLL